MRTAAADVEHGPQRAVLPSLRTGCDRRRGRASIGFSMPAETKAGWKHGQGQSGALGDGTSERADTPPCYQMQTVDSNRRLTMCRHPNEGANSAPKLRLHQLRRAPAQYWHPTLSCSEPQILVCVGRWVFSGRDFVGGVMHWLERIAERMAKGVARASS
ncbi:hypothetical protein MPLSOD_140062 [Mesorhizobium sp. SOD10]|nr:hypothetical protein MPLSOD_140062 [Mesorhizobium sp. SOD10]